MPGTGRRDAGTLDERRVLLAHENSHLRHRHHAYVQLSALTMAAVCAAVGTGKITEHRFGRAQHAYHATTPGA